MAHSTLTQRQLFGAQNEPLRSAAESAERYARMTASLQDALRALTERGPLVLLVDDAPLVDRQSLAVLAAISGHVDQHALLIAFASTPSATQSDAELMLRQRAERVKLSALSLAELHELVNNMFGAVPGSHQLARRLHAESGGNPARCLELAGQLLRRGQIRYARGTFTLPATLRSEPGSDPVSVDALDVLADLDEPRRALAALLSLCEGALTLPQLVAASGQPPIAVLEGLGALIEREAVVESAGRYALASLRLAGTLAGALSESAASRLHLAIASAVSAGGAGTPAQQYMAGRHLICAGGESRLRGAQLIKRVAERNRHDVEMTQYLSLLEVALAILVEHGYSDLECATLLSVMSAAGFYADIAAQRRYLTRTLRALVSLTGLALAVRWRPYLGAHFALLVGVLAAALTGFARRLGRRNAPSVLLALEELVVVVSCAAAAETALDEAEQAERVVRWLDPLAFAPARSPVKLAQEFSNAVSETANSHFVRAIERYHAVFAALARPVPGLPDGVRAELQAGCLHGLGQASLTVAPEQALQHADALAARSAFMAPLAETIRMSYHGYRGELEDVEEHRRRSESLALSGTGSWTSHAVITVRCYHFSLLSDDVTGLLRGRTELERLAEYAPSCLRHHALAEAHLLLIRGHVEQALEHYDRLLEGNLERPASLRAATAAMFARALREGQRAQAALALCDTQLALLPDGQADAVDFFFLSQQRALAQAALGDPAAATASLQALTERALPLANPLQLGTLHRDRALVALYARDAAAFEQSLAEMGGWFRKTKNPWLIQQCDGLIARAIKLGIRAPAVSGEQLDMDGQTFVDTAGDAAS